MKIVDLHCDTVMKLVENKKQFTDREGLHVNLDGLMASNTILQVFACFNYPEENPNETFANCNTYIDVIHHLIDANSGNLFLTTTSDDLDRCLDHQGGTGVVISIEGAAPLMGRVDKLNHFYARGVRLLTLAWEDNEFCGSTFGDNSGLTELGAELVHRCNELGVMVDLSHASDKAFFNVAEIIDKPFMASHSNARTICPNHRNLTDDMIRTLADRGGVIGLTYGSGFISPHYYTHQKSCSDIILKGLREKTMTFADADRIADEMLSDLDDATMEELVSHAIHILNTGGESCLALGSDFDGVSSLPKEMNSVHDLPNLIQEMENQGIPGRVIDKITHENAINCFKEVL
jgi:membrane dipeptidase